LTRKTWLITAALSLAALLVFAACGDDDDGGGSEADKQALTEVATTLATTNGSEATQEEIDYYIAHVTDSFLQEFGTESVDACLEDAAECIGDPLTEVSIDPESVEIDGDSGELVLAAAEGNFGFEAVKEGDEWKATGLFVPDDDIPEGTEVVDLDLTEFAFEGDLESDAVSSGDFAFHMTNTGEQAHEAILVPLPDEGAIEDLLQDESFQPEPVFVKFPFGSDEEADVALPEALEPGRYGLVCFLPDTDDAEGAPHAFKGMVAEFTVD
jgi:hypothetical protein